MPADEALIATSPVNVASEDELSGWQPTFSRSAGPKVAETKRKVVLRDRPALRRRSGYPRRETGQRPPHGFVLGGIGLEGDEEAEEIVGKNSRDSGCGVKFGYFEGNGQHTAWGKASAFIVPGLVLCLICGAKNNNAHKSIHYQPSKPSSYTIRTRWAFKNSAGTFARLGEVGERSLRERESVSWRYNEAAGTQRRGASHLKTTGRCDDRWSVQGAHGMSCQALAIFARKFILVERSGVLTEERFRGGWGSFMSVGREEMSRSMTDGGAQRTTQPVRVGAAGTWRRQAGRSEAEMKLQIDGTRGILLMDGIASADATTYSCAARRPRCAKIATTVLCWGVPALRRTGIHTYATEGVGKKSRRTIALLSGRTFTLGLEKLGRVMSVKGASHLKTTGRCDDRWSVQGAHGMSGQALAIPTRDGCGRGQDEADSTATVLPN
ncbi:hypothetical protein R3P38DRAFT_2802331 [Favolaschia claudopus]|uniref:Uncharacterized protein n=1 Tax=Favolaschia claudopus TaxID=2862362 RepID=A0AAV9ZUQ6_9AGAR